MRVEGGFVTGVAGESGITSYRGLPFAAPPVRELRWRPPQPVVPWDGTRAATEFGASCSQDSRLGPPGKTSEDCLYLNVYTPANARNARVMVWIHGGSNLNGAGANCDGAAFARDGIVTVTLNYRLGALGFFEHPEITRAASPTEGLANAGARETAALGELKGIPAEQLVAENAERAQWPVVDGRFMTETPLQAVANGHVVDVPLIIGTNSFEASLIAATEKDPQKLTDWTNAMAALMHS